MKNFSPTANNDNSNFLNKRRIKHEVIYVDESGNPGMTKIEHNNKHPFFIMGFCYCKKSKKLDKNLHRLLLKLHKDSIYPKKLKELKFYPTPALIKLGYSSQEIESKWGPHYPTVRKHIADTILAKSDGVFAGILNKTNIQNNVWTAEDIGNVLFKKSLFENILPKISPVKPPIIIYDRGRLSRPRTEIFNKTMSDMSVHYSDNQKILFRDVDSVKTPGIWASDFVAGSFHFALKHNDFTYVDLLEPNFIDDGSFELF